jgi:membrane associated rhomboid family serine protease
MAARRALVLGTVAIGLVSVPSSSSFVAYVRTSRPHTFSWIGSWAAAPQSTNLLLVRVGEYQGRRYCGLFGVWLPLPSLQLPTLELPSLRLPARLCAFGPLEALACVHALVFALWQPPRLRAWMRRHFTLSPAGLRAGRAHTLLTSALSHADVLHLAHNTLSLLSLRALSGRLMCARLCELLCAAALASSAASAWWQAHEWRRGAAACTLGASGVVLALRAVSASLGPSDSVWFYGVEMPARRALLAQCALDVALDAFRRTDPRAGRGTARPASGSAIDVGGLVGGALCGWWYARYRWR